MPEDPEEVLPQQRIGTRFDAEEVGPEAPVEGEQEQRDRDDRNGEQQQELRDQQHPGEHRHAHERHALGAHVQHRGDEVDGTDQ